MTSRVEGYTTALLWRRLCGSKVTQKPGPDCPDLRRALYSVPLLELKVFSC